MKKAHDETGSASDWTRLGNIDSHVLHFLQVLFASAAGEQVHVEEAFHITTADF